jgi:hypothetical protein
MINALGNYIGNSTPIQPLIIDGFIENININDETAYLIINYESGNANPLNGTGSFRFDTPKEIEYFIVGAGGKGGQARTPWQPNDPVNFGAGGGGGGIVSGSLIIEKDKDYIAIAGNPIASDNRGGFSFLKGPTIADRIAVGGGNGGAVFLGVTPGVGAGRSGGCGGGSGYSQRASGTDICCLYESGVPGGPGENLAGTGDQSFPTAGNNGIGYGYYNGSGSIGTPSVSGSDYATQLNDGVPGASKYFGAYVDIALPAGGLGAGATNTTNQPGTSSISVGTVGSYPFFNITSNGKGGNGLLSSITGVATYYAGGGAALGVATNNETSANLQLATGSWSAGNIGGLGGGGSATGSYGYFGVGGNPNGVDGLGGGAAPGGTGGSGVVIIRYSRNQQDLIRS